MLCRVFGELAAKFQPIVDALGEISDAAKRYSQADVLRLYEVWLKTGSNRARGLLRQLGVEATPVALLQQMQEGTLKQNAGRIQRQLQTDGALPKVPGSSPNGGKTPQQ